MTPRFCLRCGRGLRRARDGDRVRLRCPRCAWTFYDNPVPAAVAVIRSRRGILLTRRAHPPYAGTWDVPGGFLEAGELPEAGLRRELREELGVGVRRARLLGFAVDRYGRGGFPLLTVLYQVTLSENRVRPADDVAEARWFPADRVPYREIAFASVRRALRRFVSGS